MTQLFVTSIENFCFLCPNCITLDKVHPGLVCGFINSLL